MTKVTVRGTFLNASLRKPGGCRGMLQLPGHAAVFLVGTGIANVDFRVHGPGDGLVDQAQHRQGLS